MTKIIIVAGGLATRMLPITEEIPKCLIDINGKPLIQHQLEFFKKNGYTEFIFCVAHLAEKVKEYFKDGKHLGVSIQYIQEQKELMGTAGSVKLAENLIGDDEDFIVYYGDNLTSMDMDAFMKFHRQNKAVATVCMRSLPPNYKSSSIITLNEAKQIRVFLEKPSEADIEKHKHETCYINSGIYAFNKKVFTIMPSNTKYDFAKQVFPMILEQRLGLYGYVTGEFFREIGRIEKYDKFVKEVAGKKDIFEKNKAVFLDRDGVINKAEHDIIKPEQFIMLPGVPEAVKRIHESGYLAFVVTNQPVIAKGLCTFEDMNQINGKMERLLAEKGASVDKIYVCPHHPKKGFAGEVPELKIDCDCRKPKPGMLLKAMQEYNIDARQSWMVGDSPTDIACGKNAGVKTVFLSTGGGSGRGDEKEYENIIPDFTKKDLNDALSLFIERGTGQ